ncbi:Ficolin-1 [Bulinus truncatus]|nr:Ficolin-1 [Bulinus truncatus]
MRRCERVVRKAMTSNLWTVTRLLAMMAVIIPERCKAEIGKTIPHFCSTIQMFHCQRGIHMDTHYIKIHSRYYDASFLCDIKTDGGGWIVIQRRVNKQTNFNQDWSAYKNGFGTLCGDHWLGNKHLHMMTSLRSFELRIDMVHKTKNYTAQYSIFNVSGENKNFELHIEGFTGDVIDDFTLNNNMQFSTPDRDNDVSLTKQCGKQYRSGWWFRDCHLVNLNGRFYSGLLNVGVLWTSITGQYGTLSAVEMKIREKKQTSNY